MAYLHLDVIRLRIGQDGDDDPVDGEVWRVLLMNGAALRHSLSGVVLDQEILEKRAQQFQFTSNFNGCHGP